MKYLVDQFLYRSIHDIASRDTSSIDERRLISVFLSTMIGHETKRDRFEKYPPIVRDSIDHHRMSMKQEVGAKRNQLSSFIAASSILISRQRSSEKRYTGRGKRDGDHFFLFPFLIDWLIANQEMDAVDSDDIA